MKWFYSLILIATVAVAAPRIIQSPSDDGVVIDGGTKAVNITTRIDADTATAGTGTTAKFQAKSVADSYGFGIESNNGSGDEVQSAWMSVNSDATNYTIFRTSVDGFSTSKNNIRLYPDGDVILGDTGASHELIGTPVTVTNTADVLLAIKPGTTSNYASMRIEGTSGGYWYIGKRTSGSGASLALVFGGGSANDNGIVIDQSGSFTGAGLNFSNGAAYILKNNAVLGSGFNNILNFTGKPRGMYLIGCSRTGGSTATNGLFWVGFTGSTVILYNTIAQNGMAAQGAGVWFQIDGNDGSTHVCQATAIGTES